MLSPLRCLAATLVLLLADSLSARASDLIYVTLSNDTVVSYDVSSNDSNIIAASAATFVSTNLAEAWGLAFDTSGNLFVGNADGNTISRFNSAGVYQSSITTHLSVPRGLAFDLSGNLLVANSSDSTIVKFDPAGTFLGSIDTQGSAPIGLAIDTAGNIYATNNSNTIDKFNSTGVWQASIGGDSNLSTPMDLALDTAGNLYVSNNSLSTLSKFNSNGIYQSGIGAISTPNNTGGLAFDSLGNLYVADSDNNAIQKYDPAGNFVTTWQTGNTPIFIAHRPAIVPEPGTWALAVVAAGVLVAAARRRKS